MIEDDFEAMEVIYGIAEASIVEVPASQADLWEIIGGLWRPIQSAIDAVIGPKTFIGKAWANPFVSTPILTGLFFFWDDICATLFPGEKRKIERAKKRHRENARRR